MALHEHFERGLGGWILGVIAPDMEARRELDIAAREFDAEIEDYLKTHSSHAGLGDSFLIHFNSIEVGREVLRQKRGKTIARTFRQPSTDRTGYDLFRSADGMVTLTTLNYMAKLIGQPRVLEASEVFRAKEALEKINGRSIE